MSSEPELAAAGRLDTPSADVYHESVRLGRNDKNHMRGKKTLGPHSDAAASHEKYWLGKSCSLSDVSVFCLCVVGKIRLSLKNGGKKTQGAVHLVCNLMALKQLSSSQISSAVYSDAIHHVWAHSVRVVWMWNWSRRSDHSDSCKVSVVMHVGQRYLSLKYLFFFSIFQE